MADYQGDISDEISSTPIAGAFYENTGHAVMRAKIAEVAIPCGLAATQGTADGQCKLPTTAEEVAKCLGVSIYLPMRNELPLGADYAIGDRVLVAQEGVAVWVAVEEAVSAGSQAYVRFASNSSLTQKGAFLDNASVTGGAATAAPLPNCRFITSSAGAGFAAVLLNLPGSMLGLAGEPVDPAGLVTGSILYRSAAGKWVVLPPGSDGQVLKLASGVPTWAADAT